ncbi:HGGxSTG domain-containing protein [Magnetococcales bacterium HHB-1]
MDAEQPHEDPKRCGAKTRAGTPCQRFPLKGKKRCRLHGGMSPGAPKGNRNAWKHGYYSREAQEARRKISQLMREAQDTVEALQELEPLQLSMG